MIRDFIDLFRGDWVERIGATLVSICALLLISIIGFGLFVAADSWFLAEREGMAEICGRDHEDEWTQIIHHSDGRGGGWMQVITHPESWTVRARIGSLTDEFPVSRDAYSAVKMGQFVRVKYRMGRLSGGLYITAAAL